MNDRGQDSSEERACGRGYTRRVSGLCVMGLELTWCYACNSTPLLDLLDQALRDLGTGSWEVVQSLAHDKRQMRCTIEISFTITLHHLTRIKIYPPSMKLRFRSLSS